MWVLAIAGSIPDKHVILRPEAKYVGNMHGNEVPSKEVLLHLIDYILTNQNTDDNVKYLLKNIRIHILPSMNPDGFEQSRVGDCLGTNGRYNANSYDLNRNFPDLFNCNSNPIQKETQAVINWFKDNDFVLSGNLHGGSVVASYPYDGYTDSMFENQPRKNPTLDDDVFRYLASNYSFNHATMRNSECESFANGITNGGFFIFY